MDEFNFENNGELPPEMAEKLEAKIEALTDASRKIGLYVDRAVVTQVPGPGGFPRMAILTQYTLGDVAFATRVQNPEQDQIDKQFDELATDLETNEFLETRERMKRNIEAGRDPLDDGDD